jgi:D-alanyl-D-alanine carboxypeptidase
MMTLYMLFEAIDSRRLTMQTRLRVSPSAAAEEPTKLGLIAGQTIAVRDVILGLITRSANDAAVVAAEALAGSEERFATQMTAKARRLGMSSTTFQNASGLPDPEQRTTARDMARLARALMRQFPHHYHFFATESFSYNGYTYANHNRFMGWYEGADGLKTGYTRASGFNLAASADRGGRRLIGVVMGGTSPAARDERMGVILDDAFARRVPKYALPPIRHAALPVEPAVQRQPLRGSIVQASATSLPAPPPPRAPSPVAQERWGVQVAAVGEAAQARHAAETARRVAPQPLKRASLELVRANATPRSPNLIRARWVGVSEAEARDACRALQRRKMACLVVQPQDIAQGVRLARF